MQMYRRKEGKMKVTIGAHTGLILTLPFKYLLCIVSFEAQLYSHKYRDVREVQGMQRRIHS